MFRFRYNVIKKFSMQEPKVTFKTFLKKFPVVELPVSLNKDAHFVFSKENAPLGELEIDQFISPYEDIEFDEFTEYVPCFSLKVDYDFYAIVYWRARLLTYEYFIATYNKAGVGLSRKKIAGQVVYGDRSSQAIAIIEKDWIIYVVEGEANAFVGDDFDPQSTNSYNLEILADGQVIFTNNEGLNT